MLRFKSTGIVLFLFAHQDDEFPVYALIEDCIRAGNQPLCLYFTNGNFKGQSSIQRNQESISVLKQLGVSADCVFFLGDVSAVADGKLYQHLELSLSKAVKLIESFASPIDSLYCHAWEGGHQDHDAVNIIGRVLANKFACINSSWQFSFYHGYGLCWKLFRVLSPLKKMGPVVHRKIALLDRLRFLKLSLHYKSQLKTWIALLPAITLSYLLDGRQKLQSLAMSDYSEKPHPGRLLYERRGYCSYDEFMLFAQAFIDKHLRTNLSRF